MGGIHDLGGRHGFGKIEVDESEEQFHEAWEARVRALVNAMARAPDWNVDWFRHCRELIEPVDYLSRPYLDQWVQTYCAMLVNSGWATVEEVSTGRAAGPPLKLPKPPMTADHVRARPMRVTRFDAEGDEPPAYKPGDQVRATQHTSTGHTRLPAYVRGHYGRVYAHHGAHVYPDDNAQKNKHHVHLYSVEFAARELWPEAAASKDSVFLDLWETYLERA